MRGVGHRHERAVRCDGRGRRDRRTRPTRTAKSCGPDVAVLALSPWEAKLLAGDGGKRAVHRGEHAISRKAIAQGRPECSACTCMLVCAFSVRNCTRDRGCSVHPVFPAPSDFGGTNEDVKLGQMMPRDRECLASRCLTVESEIHPHVVQGPITTNANCSKGNLLHRAAAKPRRMGSCVRGDDLEGAAAADRPPRKSPGRRTIRHHNASI
jgi:hypothetical protein